VLTQKKTAWLNITAPRGHWDITGISLGIWKWCRIHMDPHGSTDMTSVKSRHIPPESTPSFVVGRKTLKGKGLKRLPGTSKCLTVFDTPKIALISSAADKISDSACAWTMLEHIVRYWYIYWWYCKMFQPQVSLFNIAAFIHSLSFSLAKRSKQPTRGS
jgi:hypothetical protein